MQRLGLHPEIFGGDAQFALVDWRKLGWYFLICCVLKNQLPVNQNSY